MIIKLYNGIEEIAIFSDAEEILNVSAIALALGVTRSHFQYNLAKHNGNLGETIKDIKSKKSL